MFLGRSSEYQLLKDSLLDSVESRGIALLISGDAGIGKTSLVDAFLEDIGSETLVLRGQASQESGRPFLMVSSALDELAGGALFEEHEYQTFAKIFVMDNEGHLLAEASPEDDVMGSDMFASMLSAVQSFVADSFDPSRDNRAGLGKLEMGEMKVMMEHGDSLLVTGVVKGTEHPEMRQKLKKALKGMENETSGFVSGQVQTAVNELASSKFLVRKDLAGLKIDQERMRMADRALDLLNDAASERHIIMVLEDLHWADESSLYVFKHLARNIAASSILVIATRRPKEGEATQAIVSEMIEDGTLSEIVLGSLDETSISGIAGQMYPSNTFPSSFLARLSVQCEGNPFFIKEMLWQMGVDGNISNTNEGFSLVNEDYTIPDTVQEVVKRRLDILDPGALALAEYASCIGIDFSLEEANSFSQIQEIGPALAALEDTGIIVGRQKFKFTHAIYQNYLYSSIGNRWKSVYHKSLGEYYESGFENRQDEVLYELARHFSKTSVHSKGFEYSMRAGEKAEAAMAPEQAVDFYRTALEIMDRAKTDIPKAELLERLGDLLALLTQYDEAIENLEAAELLSQDETKARIGRKIGDIYERRGEYDNSLDVLGRAIISAEPGTPEHGRIRVSMGTAFDRKGEKDKATEQFDIAQGIFESSSGCERDLGGLMRAFGRVHWSMGEYDKARYYMEKSLAIMQEVDDKEGIYAALLNVGMVHTILMQIEEGLAYYTKALALAKEIGDAYAIAYILYNMGYSHMMLGDWDSAKEHFDESIEMRNRMGDKRGIVDAWVGLGQTYSHWGQIDKALEYHTKCLEVREQIGNKFMIEVSLFFIAGCHRDFCDLEKAEEYYLKSLAISAETGNKNRVAAANIEYAKLFLLRGQHDEALKRLEQSLEYYIKAASPMYIFEASMAIAEVYLELGDVEKAEAFFEQGKPHASDNPEMIGYMHSVHGMLLAAKGDWPSAIQSFEDGISTRLESRAMSDMARDLVTYGKALRTKGDEESANEKFDRALAIFGELGLDRCAANVLDIKANE